MLYYLFGWLDQQYDLVGAGVFKYISFRAVLALVISLVISILFGSRLINYLRFKQVGETIRDLGLQGQMEKKGTPTMGGIIILMAVLIPTLLLARIDNIYVILCVLAALWMGIIGFADDYIKVFLKNKEGLKGIFKIIGQVGLGLTVGLIMTFHPDVEVREYSNKQLNFTESKSEGEFGTQLETVAEQSFTYKDTKSLTSTVPFVKNNSLDYNQVFGFMNQYAWVGYILLAIVVVTAVSNGANITDGIDGLAAGSSAIIILTLAVLAYLSGNTIFSQYLNIMYIPNTGELVIFAAAFLGACVGFLWYNSYPAQVFMGDTGSLAIGGIIAVMALILRKELLLPLLCGIFVVENLSVMLQVSYFKYTKRKFGEGRRIFKMSPLHHHYQKLGYHESKIVTRFWIVGIFLAAITLATLKLR